MVDLISQIFSQLFCPKKEWFLLLCCNDLCLFKAMRFWWRWGGVSCVCISLLLWIIRQIEKPFGVTWLVISLLFASESTLAGTEQQGYCDEDNWAYSGSSSGSGSGSRTGSGSGSSFLRLVSESLLKSTCGKDCCAVDILICLWLSAPLLDTCHPC